MGYERLSKLITGRRRFLEQKARELESRQAETIRLVAKSPKFPTPETDELGAEWWRLRETLVHMAHEYANPVQSELYYHQVAPGDGTMEW